MNRRGLEYGVISADDVERLRWEDNGSVWSSVRQQWETFVDDVIASGWMIDVDPLEGKSISRAVSAVQTLRDSVVCDEIEFNTKYHFAREF